MVKLKLRSPFRSDETNQGGRRRSTRIQHQQRQKEETERVELERLMGETEKSGQRRSFDDINSSTRPGSASQAFRMIFSGNKKSKRSTSAAGKTHTAGALRMFRPLSRGVGGEMAGSFETLDVGDTSSESFDVEMADEYNALDWMMTDAPPDVLPKILSFCGSRKLNALSRVNKRWNNAITGNDVIWRVMCEDTHKWNEGDEVPVSWLEHYKSNPVLPFDYDSVDSAFDAISSGPKKVAREHNNRIRHRDQTKNARILLQPGPYFIRRSLVCNVIGSAHITIECLVGNDPRHGLTWSKNYNKSSENARAAISKTSSILKVTRPSAAHLSEVFAPGLSSPIPQQHFNETNNMADLVNGIMNGNYPLTCVDGANPTAFLIFDTRSLDQPCIRVRQGAVTLRGLKFLHYSEGTDIWNGNTAIQVQGPFHKGEPLAITAPCIPPTAHVIDCDIQSLSGRGVVSIDGGITRIDRCFIHNSAATGLYLGGRGSVATITRTDVYENGNGNDRHRNMGQENVRRGHSGIYVEQGTVRVLDCNISKNSLTGMSGISEDKATLQIENSDIVSNGSVQLELPPHGSASRERSFSRGNNISAFREMGQPRTRFLKEHLKPRDINSGPVGSMWSPVPQSPSEFPLDNVTRAAGLLGVAAADNRVQI